MTDDPKNEPAETPMQRALRLKKAAQDARTTPGGGKVRPTAGITAGASKPWMKK